MSVDVPVFGFSGSDVRPTPGPLFWEQKLESYRASASGASFLELKAATEGPGALASPGSDVTYMKVGGGHGMGSAPGRAGSSAKLAERVAEKGSPVRAGAP